MGLVTFKIRQLDMQIYRVSWVGGMLGSSVGSQYGFSLIFGTWAPKS